MYENVMSGPLHFTGKKYEAFEGQKERFPKLLGPKTCVKYCCIDEPIGMVVYHGVWEVSAPFNILPHAPF